MTPFNWRGKQKTSAFDDAANTFIAAAKTGIVVAKNFPTLDSKELQCLEAIMFYTKAAFIIQSLRLLEQNSSNPHKWKSLLIAFERQIFPPNPLEAMELVKYVNHLIDLTVRLQRLNTDKTVDIDDYRQRARLWWEEWLDPMSADPVTLDHISFEIGIEVFQNIWQEMSHISRLISSVGAGLGTTA